MITNFKKYIKAVGTGPKGNEDIAFDEMKMAMDMILSREATDNQISAFMLGWRLKPETIEEYKAALLSFDQRTRTVDIGNSIELGFPFDGKNNSPYLFPLTAKFLRPYSLSVVVTGDLKVPSKDGVTTKSFMEAMGNIDNVHYFDRSIYLPELSQLTALRNDLGLRTAFNTLEKFSRVGNSKFAASGVFHKPYVQKYIEIFKDIYECLILISANEGGPEIYKKGKCWRSRGDKVEEFLIDPAEFGIQLNLEDTEFTLEDSVRICRDPDLKHMKIAALNAAVYLFCIGLSDNYAHTYEELTARI